MKLMETIQASFDHLIRENPMGEVRKDALKLDFDRRLKFEFHGTKVTSDAGVQKCLKNSVKACRSNVCEDKWEMSTKINRDR